MIYETDGQRRAVFALQAGWPNSLKDVHESDLLVMVRTVARQLASDEVLGEASGVDRAPEEHARKVLASFGIIGSKYLPTIVQAMLVFHLQRKALSASPVPVDASGTEPVAPKVFRATTPIDLMQKVFKHHGWPITLGRMAARFNTLYELSADARNNRYVATPRLSHTAPVADAQAGERAIEEAVKREREGCARKAQRYIRGMGSMTSEEAARGVAHEIRTRTTKDTRHD